jgi:hypothetical protein
VNSVGTNVTDASSIAIAKVKHILS